MREIKTTLTLDGEKQFKQELEAAGREMRVMNADLKAMAAEFDSSGDAQRYFTQRSEAMTNKVKQQEEIVRALSNAVRDSAEKYGSAAKQTDTYRIKLSNATEQLYRMRKEADEAERELQELGRNSEKIGRNIKEGIGDSAEDTAEKLDGMFSKIQQDVNAMKSSVAFQTTMDVGSFVFDSIQNVMGFVEENREFNRRLAQTRSVVEMYGYNADEIMRIAQDAASVTGDFEGAQEALVNLAAAGFENEEQIAATMQNLLGIWLSSGGTLDFSGLAEDYLESVKERTPTGTYAEAIIKFTDKSVEDVQKVLEKAKTHADALEIATATLTEAGLATKAEEYANKNQELLDAEKANLEMQMAWAALAAEIQPVVTSMIEGTTNIVNGLTEVVRIMSDSDFAKQKLKEDQPEFAEALEGGQLDTFGGTLKYFFSQLFPGAGAEEIPAEWGQYGEEIGSTVITGMEQGMQMEGGKTTAADAAIGTVLAQMMAEDKLEDAKAAGNNLMVSFGNGIAEGAAVPIGNVKTMVDSINSMLNQIAVPAFGAGFSGITGGTIGLYMDSQKVGALTAGSVSRSIGRGVQTKMTVN